MIGPRGYGRKRMGGPHGWALSRRNPEAAACIGSSMDTVMNRRMFLALAGGKRLMAGQPPWERPFKEWSSRDAERVLTDSPWARQIGVRFRLGNGAGAMTEVYLTMRWSSALPVRQALALERWGRDGLQSAAAVEWLEANQPDYVLEIFGFPATLYHRQSERVEKQIAETAGLYVRGQVAVRAKEVRVPEHGMHMSATVRFPRALTADLGDEVEFIGKAGPAELREKFKLKNMRYEGRIEM